MTRTQRWSRRLVVVGVTSFALAVPLAVFANLMGFNFDPTEEPSDYWPVAVSHYWAVLCVAIVLASLGLVCSAATAIVMQGESSSTTVSICAAVIGIGLVLLALRGALPAIEQAQIWSTRPPI